MRKDYPMTLSRPLPRKNICICYLILSTAACGAMLVTNLSYDAEYQLAMAYRLVKGDFLITQMWEPNQTSAFLCALLMKLYLCITHTTTGIVLFTQAAGLLFRLGVCLFLFRTLKDCADTPDLPALTASLLFLLLSPKGLLIPEYSNMQVWFATLTALFLVRHYSSGRLPSLILSAVSLCLGVFSYPSLVVCYAAVFFLLLRYAPSPRKSICLFTGVCAAIGGAFIAWLLIRIGPDRLFLCLSNALALEPTHTVSYSEKWLAHLLNGLRTVLILALIGLAALVVERILCLFCKKADKKRAAFSTDRWLLLFWLLLFLVLTANTLAVKNDSSPSYPLLFLAVLGFGKRSLLSEKERPVYLSAFAVSCMNLLATLLLSDHGVMQAIPYMQLAVCIAALPLYRWFLQLSRTPGLKTAFCCAVHGFLLLLLFRCIYIHVPIYGRSQICSLSSDLGLIRSGPAIGIITDEEGAARQRDSMREWKEYIRPGDTIWILGEPVDTLGYLYEDVLVGAPTVMSTPSYSEELLTYWELNPDKYPDVVIVSSGFGELAWDMRKNQWLMDWLQNGYQAETIIDGNYWRYYFKAPR